MTGKPWQLAEEGMAAGTGSCLSHFILTQETERKKTGLRAQNLKAIPQWVSCLQQEPPKTQQPPKTARAAGTECLTLWAYGGHFIYSDHSNRCAGIKPQSGFSSCDAYCMKDGGMVGTRRRSCFQNVKYFSVEPGCFFAVISAIISKAVPRPSLECTRSFDAHGLFGETLLLSSLMKDPWKISFSAWKLLLPD